MNRRAADLHVGAGLGRTRRLVSLVLAAIVGMAAGQGRAADRALPGISYSAKIPAPGMRSPEINAAISGEELVRRISKLRPGHWLEIPGSEMARVQVDACQSPEIWRGYDPVLAGPPSCNPDAVMAYSGGAYDSRRHRMMVWGGGHSGYIGNELYAFDLTLARWIRLSEPSTPVLEPGWGDGAGALAMAPNAGPISVHSYDQLEYLPKQDALFAAGGSTYSGNGFASEQTWILPLSGSDAMHWKRADPMPGRVYGLYEYNMSSAYDPLSERVIVRGYSRAASFDPEVGRWLLATVRLPTRRLGTVGELDPEARGFLVTGGGRSEWHVVSAEGMLGAMRPLPTTGDREIEDCYAPGLAYSMSARRMVAWCGGGAVYVLDARRSRWIRFDPPAASPAPGFPHEQSGVRGVFGRFRYVPEYDVFVLVLGNRANVFLYRLPERRPSQGQESD